MTGTELDTLALCERRVHILRGVKSGLVLHDFTLSENEDPSRPVAIHAVFLANIEWYEFSDGYCHLEMIRCIKTLILR